MIDCKQYVSELKSCDDFPKWLYVDAEYCATLDHTGKPISEFGERHGDLVRPKAVNSFEIVVVMLFIIGRFVIYLFMITKSESLIISLLYLQFVLVVRN